MFARLFREEAGPRGDFKPWCSRGCFGKRPAQEEIYGLRGAVVLVVLFARLFEEEAGPRGDLSGDGIVVFAVLAVVLAAVLCF